MGLKTRLKEKLGIEHPILLAPMGAMADGRLAEDACVLLEKGRWSAR
ncbi:hypothetical protein [Duganella sp. CF458]|nr:hypothetical protein [Duganella sp. CF458]